MQRQSRGIDEHVQQRDAKGCCAHNKALHALIKGNFFLINAFHSDAPCAHTQSLSPMTPEPIKEEKRYQHQYEFIAPVLNRFAIIQWHNGGCDDEVNSYEQQAVV